MNFLVMCYCVLLQVHWSLLQKWQILQIRLCELVAAGGVPGVDHSEGESLLRGERKEIPHLGSASPCARSLLPRGE